MEDDQEPPLFRRHSDQNLHRRHRQSSHFRKPWSLIIALLLTVTLLVLLFLLPSLYSFSGKFFRRGLITKSFDTFTLLLVLICITFAILRRNTPVPDDPIQILKWCEEYSGNPNGFSGEPRSDNDGGNQDMGKSESDLGFPRLRSSSSYPDLRPDSWVPGGDRRFSDDIGLYNRGSSENCRRLVENAGNYKAIEGNGFFISDRNTNKPKRKFEAISSRKKKKKEVKRVLESEEKTPQKTGEARDIGGDFPLLYHHVSSSDQRKNKKKIENFSSYSFSSPPPPPPPPPSSVISDWFGKESQNRRKEHSNHSELDSISKPKKEKVQLGLETSKIEYPIAKSKTTYENLGIIDLSSEKNQHFPRPLLMPAMCDSEREIEVLGTVKDQKGNNKNRERSSFSPSSIPLASSFPVHGGYVRNPSQISGNSETEVEMGTQESMKVDVNSKAEAFIAQLRAGWKLEKLKSMKEKMDKTVERK